MSDDDKLKNLENRSWEAMRVLLDQEMPQKKKRKAAFWLWWSAGLSGVAAMLFLFSYIGSNVEPAHDVDHVSVPSIQSSASMDQMQIEEENAQSDLAIQSGVDASPDEILAANDMHNNAYAKLAEGPISNQQTLIQVKRLAIPAFKSSQKSENFENQTPISDQTKEELVSAGGQTTADDNPFSVRTAGSTELITSRNDKSLAELPFKQSFIRHKFNPTIDPETPTSSYALSENVQTEGGLYLSNTTFASLNTPGLFESGLQLTYKIPLHPSLALSFGGNLSYNNLSVNYFDPQVYPQGLASQADKLYQNVAYDEFNVSSSVNATKKKSSLNWRASTGLAWQMSSNWSLATELGLRQYAGVGKNGLLTEKSDVATPGFSTNVPKEFAFKAHYFQTLGISYHIQKRWSVSAIYMLTGQPFTTGFYISKPIGSTNHFAGLGISYRM
ncbi:MAG: hypothetical protein KDC49_22175 [Saprospiraceae bacterium]|nr:hypothetical protein [Saprospiraceae bacterium]